MYQTGKAAEFPVLLSVERTSQGMMHIGWYTACRLLEARMTAIQAILDLIGKLAGVAGKQKQPAVIANSV